MNINDQLLRTYNFKVKRANKLLAYLTVASREKKEKSNGAIMLKVLIVKR